jgi:UDP-N-acetylmuramoyl-tripeptide--D-alanyl-D-alanine ligase
LAALTVASCEGLPAEDALASLLEVEPVPGRLAPVPLANGALIISDEFKSSLETVETALDVLEQIPAKRRICVLGDVTEPPDSQGPVYRALGERIARVADLAIFVGEAVRRYTAGTNLGGMPASSVIRVRHDFPRAIEFLKRELRPGDVVLVKGRSTERLDRIVLALSGVDVRCTIRFCDARATRCRHCKMLERGWSTATPKL